jgi:hypothetical protein
MRPLCGAISPILGRKRSHLPSPQALVDDICRMRRSRGEAQRQDAVATMMLV